MVLLYDDLWFLFSLVKNEIIKYPKELVVGLGLDNNECFVPKKNYEQQMAAIEDFLEFDVSSGKIRIDKQSSSDEFIINMTLNDTASFYIRYNYYLKI